MHFFSQGHCRFGSTDVFVIRIRVLGPPLPQGIDAEPFRGSVSLLYTEDGERCLARLLCGGSETSAGPHLLPHWQLSPPTASHLQLTCRSWTFPGGEHTGPLGIQGQRPGASSLPDPRPRPWFLLPSPLRGWPGNCQSGTKDRRALPSFYTLGGGPDEMGGRQASRDPASGPRPGRRPGWCHRLSLPGLGSEVSAGRWEEGGPWSPKTVGEPFLRKPERCPSYLLAAPHRRCRLGREQSQALLAGSTELPPTLAA